MLRSEVWGHSKQVWVLQLGRWRFSMDVCFTSHFFAGPDWSHVITSHHITYLYITIYHIRYHWSNNHKVTLEKKNKMPRKKIQDQRLQRPQGPLHLIVAFQIENLACDRLRWYKLAIQILTSRHGLRMLSLFKFSQYGAMFACRSALQFERSFRHFYLYFFLNCHCRI